MNCRGVRRHIQSLVTGELDRTTAAQVLEHIESCAECAAEKAAYERLIADLSTPHPMATLPASLDELRIPDTQPRRVPVLRLAMVSVGVVAIVAVLVMSAHKQPVQPHRTTPPRQQVAQMKVPPVVPECAPVRPPTRLPERRAVIVHKSAPRPNLDVRRRVVPHAPVKQQPKPSQQDPAVKPDVNQSEQDLEVMAQASASPTTMDIEITDQTTGQTHIERRIGTGAVCSLVID